MTWKISYILLILVMPSLGIFIYKKIAEPLSSYIVDGNIEINEDEYSTVYSENEKLVNQVKKLKRIIKKKGDR